MLFARKHAWKTCSDFVILVLMHSSEARQTVRLVISILLFSALLLLPGSSSSGEESSFVLTNVAQLRSLAAEQPESSYEIRLEGDVLWARAGTLVLRDTSGTEILEAELSGPPFASGERIQLNGSGSIVRRGATLRLGARGPVVENDGIHNALEMSGAIYLTAGRHPFRLEWFNGTGKSGLRVGYEGPGLPRQPVPETALWRSKTGAEQGVNFRCFEGVWKNLPDFSALTPVKSGTAAKLDLKSRTRELNVALEFTGFIELPRGGMYRFYVQSDDGSRLYIGEPTLSTKVLGPANFPTAGHLNVGQLLVGEQSGAQWAEVEGRVTSVRPGSLAGFAGVEIEVRAGTGAMRVEVADEAGLSAQQLLNRRIRVTGFCQPTFTLQGETIAGLLLTPGSGHIQLLDAPNASDAPTTLTAEPLPVLTVASAIRELRTQEARRGYPVRVSGVVTCVQSERRAFVIQDSTQGLYVSCGNTPVDLPKVGEFLEVQGTTDEHAIVKLQQLQHLGEGSLPEPARPTWDQLLNGSQDSQLVEIGGLVESITDRSNGWSRMLLRSRAGNFKVDVRQAGVRPAPVEQYENAVVRLRGCLFADYMPDWRLKVGQAKMYDADVVVEQPAPPDPFSIPQTTVPALKRFDPAFEVSRRVKVAGQIVYARGADYFVMDGTNGLRFLARQPLGYVAGDTIEVVGFPELSGAAPVLRAAVARKTGHASLPEPAKLEADDLLVFGLDSTLVRVEGMLAGFRDTGTNVVLDMQSGPWRYLARFNGKGPAHPLRVSSRLELSGVYCAQGGYQALGADFAPVDILLNDLEGIVVLAQPPWWTLPRLLVAIGILAVALAVTVLWITQLRRQVEERTAQLELQIQSRQQLEQKRALDQERTRIAQDLHDELGSDIATIGMLATRAQFASAPEERRGEYLDQVRGKARDMVSALDEIVWAMNPGHDTLTSLVNYLGRYAERFLGLADISLRLESQPDPADVSVDSRLRHQVFLAFKEALANVVHHAEASEVRVSIHTERGELRVGVADNGRGLPVGQRPEELNGLSNMRDRVERLRGRFEVSGAPGQGTTVRFSVPLAESHHATRRAEARSEGGSRITHHDSPL